MMNEKNIYLKKIQIFQTNMESFLDAGLKLTKSQEIEEADINQVKRQVKKNIQDSWGKKDEIFINELIDKKSQEVINKWYENIFNKSKEKKIDYKNYEEKFKITLDSAKELWNNSLNNDYSLKKEFYDAFHYTYESITELLDLNRTINIFLIWMESSIELGGYINSIEKNDILANFYCRKFSLIEKMLFEASAELFSKKLIEQKVREKFSKNNVYDLLFNNLLKPRVIKGNKFIHYSFLVSEEKLIKNEIEYIKKNIMILVYFIFYEITEII